MIALSLNVLHYIMTTITIKIGRHSFEAEIFDTPTGNAILATLPLEADVHTWGDEIYFRVDAQAALEPKAKTAVSVGDLAYWPNMPAFCIFFGPTPVSIGNEPRAASAVNVFGKLKDYDIQELRRVLDGEKIWVG